MREVYLDFLTKSLQPPTDGSYERPAYSKRMNVEMKEHNQILEDIIKGQKPMPHLEKDPLLSKDSDFVPNMEGLDGYTLRSQGTFL